MKGLGEWRRWCTPIASFSFIPIASFMAVVCMDLFSWSNANGSLVAGTFLPSRSGGSLCIYYLFLTSCTRPSRCPRSIIYFTESANICLSSPLEILSSKILILSEVLSTPNGPATKKCHQRDEEEKISFELQASLEREPCP